MRKKEKDILREIDNEIYKLGKNQLDLTSDLARLVFDCSKGKLSFSSEDFLMRMNINPRSNIE